MRLLSGYKFVLVCLIIIPFLSLDAQNDGIRGYGSFEFIELDTYGGKAYTNGGGGVIVNNNLIFGVYVSALARPFRWDLFTAQNNPTLQIQKLTNNELATNSIITNFDVGGQIGFNIAPAKSFQTTLSLKFGYSTINYLESYLDESADLDNLTLENLPVLPLDITHNDFNFSPQIDFQFKVGRAFKLSIIVGHKFQSSSISAPSTLGNIENLLIDSNIFSGGYVGFGFKFGNL